MAELKTYPIRLSASSDALLRDGIRAYGDLSGQLAGILASVDLRKLALVHFPSGRGAFADDDPRRPAHKTSIRLDVELYERVRQIATKRDVSINELFNSAIQAAFTNVTH